jgi:hypothetical protein
MKRTDSLDLLVQNLLRILSAYDELTPLELWYELGEDDAVREAVNEEEVRRRLESLAARGHVEPVAAQTDRVDSTPVKYRIRIGTDTPEDKEDGTEER